MSLTKDLDFGQFTLTVAVLCGLFGLGYYKGHADAKDGVPLTAASVAPSASVLASALSSALSPAAGGPITPPSDYEERQAAAVARKYDAIDRCDKEGGESALGFGYSVICLKKDSVKWTLDPKFPPLSEGLK